MLIVVAIIALLAGLLLAALQGARETSRRTACAANLRGLLTGFHAYAAAENDRVAPSYNMRGTALGAANPLDGWGPILQRGRYADGGDTLDRNSFVCPGTLELAGMRDGQTGVDPRNPRGYMDWPAVLTLSSGFARALPERGFDRLIRVGYWINSENPIGAPRAFVPQRHFSGSVGYGPDPSGKTLEANRLSSFKTPARLIALADGLYAGNQELTRAGDRDSRIGYRHRRAGARIASTQVALAVGHVESIGGADFPRKHAPGLSVVDIRNENLGAGPTTYADPAAHLPS